MRAIFGQNDNSTKDLFSLRGNDKFNLKIIDDECLLTTMDLTPLENMVYELGAAEMQQDVPVTDSVSATVLDKCKPYVYTLVHASTGVEVQAGEFIQFDEANLTLNVETSDPAKAGVHEFKLSVTLEDWPLAMWPAAPFAESVFTVGI